MKHLIILCRVLLCAMLLLLSLSASAQTDTLPKAVPDTTTLSTTDSVMPTLPEENVHKNKIPDYIIVIASGFVLIFLIVCIYQLMSYRVQLNWCYEQLEQMKYKKTSKESRQVSLTITCDEGYTAEFLRELATVIEDRDDDSNPDFEYETFHGCAEITTKD